ncbi:MAG: DUF4912 domain-containing protein [Pegethrix bostrychoides GSE-TBD4-15B]|jgi:ABC-type phosphate transport system substrate-binding protein|uniref:DUF4912 domain-containing protein n=1 Tax=Pegethrix bostrychoides GSE-TBD4-15B TaxID=2839662 RepID=A0A951PF88_9CYAN|nr:DUF4912 domain-containing protein [Pegethrix bostrychoides GSE-TBD4-15B]
MPSKNYLLKLSAVALTLAATPKILSESFKPLSVQAQSSGETFTLPASLPSGSELKVDGSTSMEISNEELGNKFQQQYADAKIDFAENGTDKAIEALRAGTVSVVAAGRRLTAAEKESGLKEVPLSRAKIAIIIGPENPYAGDVTFDQFARIFRGEITDWSEIGGQPGPIRFISRPEFSDTRQAFRNYPAFQSAPFQTGATAVPVATDETADVINELGRDGISYSIADQVVGNSAVKIVPMHKTLPDDPRYPFSQPRAYIYRDADPAVQAFLGYATGAVAPVAAAAVAPSAATGASPAASPSAAAPIEASPSPDAVAQAPAAQVPAATVATEQGGGFPWWLLGLPLIGGLLWWLTKGREPLPTPVAAPAAAPAAAPVVPPPVRSIPAGRIILTPRDCRHAYAYWEVDEDRKAEVRRQGGRKLAMRLYDVTDVDMEHQVPHSVKQFDCHETEPDLQVPIAVDDRDYVAELGYVTEDGRWLKVARSEHVRVPACPVQPAATATAPVADLPSPETARPAVTALAGGAALAGAAAMGAAAVGAAVGAAANSARPHAAAPVTPHTAPKSRLILTPRESRHAYAYWEVPDAEKAALKAQGGQQLSLRLHDVTGLSPDQPRPAAIEQFNCAEGDQDHHLVLPDTNRDYLAEVGYLTADGSWLKLASSNSIRALDAPTPAADAGIAGAGIGAGIAGAGIAGAGIVGAGIAGAGLGATRSVVSEPRPAENDRQQTARDVKQITVHSRRNCFLLNADQMRHLQEQTAVTKPLQPGLYQIRIKDGSFGYGVTPEASEPLVMLWIAGGKIINKETNVPVNATWSTLNGYEDVITLEVIEPTVLHAFFFDTHVEDNDGEVTLIVTQQS